MPTENCDPFFGAGGVSQGCSIGRLFRDARLTLPAVENPYELTAYEERIMETE